MPYTKMYANRRSGPDRDQFYSIGQFLVFGEELFFSFDVVGVEGNAVYGADLLALGFVEVADAFGAAGGIDFVDFLAHIDRFVRALWLAYVAVDAFVGDQQCHAIAVTCVRSGR
tara:strand:- start:1437 stop:1778 length:342 start_codon:yes stop_codon:yes gene_type:complete